MKASVPDYENRAYLFGHKMMREKVSDVFYAKKAALN